MHHALQIQEILLLIFDHCRHSRVTSDLPALARTCRAFKEPALDVLWEELDDPSPLARCLPEASCYLQISDNHYSFTRQLAEIEWCILRSYTGRVRSLLDDRDTLDWESVSIFLNPPTTEPLFPNLRSLRARRLTEIKIKHLLHMPFPSLTSLDLPFVKQEYLHSLQGSLESFFEFSPKIRILRVFPVDHNIPLSNFFTSYIRRWRNLQTVECCNITLDVDALAHLSRMPALTWLDCTASTTLPPADSPLMFSNLHHLRLYSEFVDPVSQLLSRTRLPAITEFTVYIERCLSKHGFSSVLTSVQTSAIGHTIQELQFEEGLDMHDGGDVMYVLGFEDLQPCMAFSKLRNIYFDLGWDVDLSDSEMLTLASAWPHLEHLFINPECGWNTPGGITPNGLLHLLQICPSLSEIGLAIDTRGYTEFHESRANLGLSLSPTFSIDVLDSLIEEESVPAIAAFLVGIAPCPNFPFRAHRSAWFTEERPDHEARWYEAYNLANVVLSQRS